MVKKLNFNDNDFNISFRSLIRARKSVPKEVDKKVSNIIADVRTGGDASLRLLTAKYDGFEISDDSSFIITNSERFSISKSCDKCTFDALRFAADRIRTFHEKQTPEDISFEDDLGVSLGSVWRPISSVGLYVPGGTASYPSSVLMNALPAKVAGVPRIVMVVPSQDGNLNPAVVAAAEIAGVDEVWRIGGAQAIAALAYGTETLDPVDKIVGPGNMWVATAKQKVYGDVGIDMIAGPSEILVVADSENDPSWIAADLLSQAEHDESAQSILITDDNTFANEVEKNIANYLKTLSRHEIASLSWEEHGAIIIVPSLEDDSPDLVNKIAPEHLEIATENPKIIADRILNVGAIFLGRYTPEAIGDYVAGTNHVLPTSGSARFSSSLSVPDFLKRTSIVSCNSSSLKSLAPSAIKLAEVEGLGAHALSVSIRITKDLD
ncbi:MAG: histidinol dehydrogenase [Alphaproteobacteria bacterium]|nr:histidinol dehydrogenase [Alphaproteobacteria bacterium]|tara:strand:- start:12031 stop:13338 length:1308 start_codon:yes stop_codon:yes gene_type:complete